MRPLLFLLFASAALATPITVTNAIPLTGNGTWYSDPLDMGGITSVSAGGINGIGDGVEFSYTSECLGAGGPGISLPMASPLSGCAHGTAVLDGVYSLYFSAFLSGSTGSVTLFDSGGNILASADITGYVNVTSEVYSGPGNRTVNGTFTIGTPEPATFLPVGLGIAASCLVLLRRRS
jgi:hypothetical protein